jgi:hypothetical protein
VFLVGWEVNIHFGKFGAVWERARTNRKDAKSTNLYVEVCILLVGLLLLCCLFTSLFLA